MLPFLGGVQAASAAALTQIVMLPRLLRPCPTTLSLRNQTVGLHRADPAKSGRLRSEALTRRSAGPRRSRHRQEERRPRSLSGIGSLEARINNLRAIPGL